MILTNLLSTGFAVTSLATLYFYLKARQNHILAVRLMRETVVEMDAKDPYFNGHIKNVEYPSDVRVDDRNKVEELGLLGNDTF